MEVIGRMTRQERVLKAKKRKAREERIGQPWNTLTLKEKARFTARYEYDPSRKKYVLRKNQKDITTVLKALKKKSKTFKRKAGRMGKKASRIKRSYSPISISLAAAKHLGLFVDITEEEEPEEILASVLMSFVKKNLSPDSIKTLTKYYSRPLSIEAFAFKSYPIVLIKEDEGMYTFEGDALVLSKIKKGFSRLASSAQFDTIKFDSSHKDVMETIFGELT